MIEVMATIEREALGSGGFHYRVVNADGQQVTDWIGGEHARLDKAAPMMYEAIQAMTGVLSSGRDLITSDMLLPSFQSMQRAKATAEGRI